MAGIESHEPLSVSVVVPSIGRGVLADVVTEALAQNPLEVVVVADANPDDVARVLDEAGLSRDPRLRVLRGPGRGAALARQVGVDAVTGDLVLLLDDDVVPGPGLVAGHTRVHGTAPDLVVVGYMPVAGDLVERRVTAAIYSDDYERECRVLDADPTRVLSQLWAGNLSLRRTDCVRVPQAVATFLDSAREDEEFGFRCLAAGLVGLFDRSLVATHHHDRSVPAFLKYARAQAAAAHRLREQYPDLIEDGDDGAAIPTTARLIVWASSAPVIGGLVREGVVRSAAWLGRGTPTRTRVRAVVLARLVVQAAA